MTRRPDDDAIVAATTADDPPASARRETVAIALVYLGYFAALGVQGPYLALYLQHRGLSPSDAAYLLAVLPAVRVLATPAWTALADAWRSSSRVLRLVAFGALASFAPLELSTAPLALIAAALVAFTAARAPATSLMDVLALDRAARSGVEFGRLRSWGTVGYTLATFTAGVLVRARGPMAIVHAALALLALHALATLRLPRAAPAAARPRLLSALSVLLARPRFVAFLAAVALHQVGLAAYDSLFVPYLARLASATHAGAAVAFGAAAEVLFMARAGRLMARLGPERTLALAFAGSAARWAVLARATSPVVLVLAQGLHALTFGAFYLGAVALVDRESPPDIRASAQGVFSTVGWGLASSAALALAGRLIQSGGMPRVFAVATGASVGATAIALALARTSRPR